MIYSRHTVLLNLPLNTSRGSLVEFYLTASWGIWQGYPRLESADWNNLHIRQVGKWRPAEILIRPRLLWFWKLRHLIGQGKSFLRFPLVSVISRGFFLTIKEFLLHGDTFIVLLCFVCSRPARARKVMLSSISLFQFLAFSFSCSPLLSVHLLKTCWFSVIDEILPKTATAPT